MRQDILSRKREIERWIAEKRSKSFICFKMNCKPSTLNRYLALMGIRYQGNTGRKGFGRPHERRRVEYYLVYGKLTSSHELKKKLIRDGVKEAKCEQCQLTEWRGRKIPLELHHRDGNRANNLAGNLELVCPNCHAFTENYRGRALKVNKPKTPRKRREGRPCLQCGSIAAKAKNKKYCSMLCFRMASRKLDRPSREILAEEIKQNNYEQLGRKYRVSGNAVRKWARSYGIFSPKHAAKPASQSLIGH